MDHLYYFLTGVTLFFTAVIFLTIFYFAIKYRRRSQDEKPPLIHGSLRLEIVWTVIPFVITVIIFVWSASLYFRNARPPEAAMEIFVVGKQWMWVLQHPEGPKEINELHVPVGRPVKLTMTSQDVIHGFYIPAFRIKRDVLPDRYSSIWFQATQTGKFHLFCTQYCGASHAGMKGWVHVMTPADYEEWLIGAVKGESMSAGGAKLFAQLGCIACHAPDSAGRGPLLEGEYGKPIKLQDGRTVVMDEAYIRESILDPTAKLAEGYPPLMPTFQGQVTEEQILELIAFIKSLGTKERKPPPQ